MESDTPRMTVRQAARARKPLDGVDAQALEGALQQVERELAQAKAEKRDPVYPDLVPLRKGM